MKKILMLVLLMFAAMSVGAQVYTVDPDTLVIIEDIDSTQIIVEPDSIIGGNVVDVDSINPGETVDLDTVYTVHSITQEEFKELIADYNVEEWVMKNPRPVIVDFYADWCQPCKQLEPILRQVAQHYNGEVDFYRIDVDENTEIADVFMIRSIPMLLICPLEGEPKTIIGLYPQPEYIRVINLALGL